MADIADVLTADPDPDPKRRSGGWLHLAVVLDGVTTTAVTIDGATYQPTEGDRVVTIPLSNGQVLILGPTS